MMLLHKKSNNCVNVFEALVIAYRLGTVRNDGKGGVVSEQGTHYEVIEFNGKY